MHAVIAGTGGIGTAVARRLLRDDATVTTTYHRNKPDEFDSVQLDATSASEVERAFGEIGPFDTLVVTTGHRHDLDFFARQSPQLSEEIIRTELVGPMNLVRGALKVFGEYGRIVIIGSDSGKAGTLGDAASSAARAGLMGFVRSIARETARNDITINIISPGPTDTDLLAGMLEGEGLTAKVMGGTVRAIPKGRTATPEEIAEAVAYFVGPHSGFTTGQVLSVSGGLTM
ncbi:SDR family NAD(P)-dependent oxidoreductase [Corynebacterium lubricantis]|uniref:SDR family NAD(P)-dependent oxidoreductase n=1 Tax=Corynebacterium lubricantis TaxID=541095 RepID=UPI0003710647|nr:SDR family oxidoreductase [Corynebacterium lubricantis]